MALQTIKQSSYVVRNTSLLARSLWQSEMVSKIHTASQLLATAQKLELNLHIFLLQ